jgi:hypothetical protein
MLRVARFLHGYAVHPRSRVLEEELSVPVGGSHVPATLFRPRSRRALPGWLVLHGITVPGRRHPMLTRFARSLAASGGVVIIPEIQPWQQLRMDPHAADAIIAASAHALAQRREVRPGGISLVGFSFGATQALITASHDAGIGEIRSVVGFGGYCDLRRTLTFQLTGEHEWEGTAYRLDPDPYGRWIVASNYLTRVRGYEAMGPVAAAAGELAAEAGRVGVYAADPLFDPLKADLRTRLTREEAEIWDLIAPPAGARPEVRRARELAEALVEAALLEHPVLDPAPLLPTLRTRLVLAHGRADHLIPFTETLRLRSRLPVDAPVDTFITRLFAHSTESGGLPPHRYPVEVTRYLRLLSRALGG